MLGASGGTGRLVSVAGLLLRQERMMSYFSIGISLCVVGSFMLSTAIAFIIADGFFGDQDEKES